MVERKHRIKLGFFFCALAILCSLDQLVAQDTTILDLDPVVVTGTRIEQQKSKVPASVTVVNRTSLERSGQSNILPTLARHVPGFFLNARNPVGYGVGPNSGGSISMRGVSGSPNTQVLILIDGQPQFMGIFGHPIADAYTASDVERVEVLRGAASLLYGSNAMGGAINIITRDPKNEGLHGHARLSYGSYNTGIFGGNVRYRQNKLKIFASVNREQTDGFRSDAKDDFTNTTGYLKLGYDINSKFDLTIDGNIADASYYHPGPTNVPFDKDLRGYLRGRGAISLENTFDKVQGALKVFYNYGKHDFDTGFKSNDYNRGLTFYQGIQFLSNSILTLGIDHKQFGGEAENNAIPIPVRVGLNEPHEINETEAYAIVQHHVSDRLSLNAGWRFVDNSIFGSSSVPGAGLTFQAGEHTVLKVNASKAFRSPTVNDLFLFVTSFDDLQPEDMWNYELSLDQRLLENKIRLEATAFLMEGNNLIQIIPTGMPGPPQRRNTGSFTNKGLEIQAKYQASPKVDLAVNYSWLDVSTSVLFAPKHNLNLQTHYSHHDLTIRVGFDYIHGLRTTGEPNIPFEDYFLANARAAYHVLPNVQLFAQGENLFDVAYETQHRFPMPGVNVLGGINIHF